MVQSLQQRLIGHQFSPACRDLLALPRLIDSVRFHPSLFTSTCSGEALLRSKLLNKAGSPLEERQLKGMALLQLVTRY